MSGRARTAETYLAGLGASGALIAGAIVIFLLLVGLVTFDAWPSAGGLLGSDDGVEAVDAGGPAETAAEALAPAAGQVASTGARGASLTGDGGPGAGGGGGGDGSRPGQGTGTTDGTGDSGGGGGSGTQTGGSTVGDAADDAAGNTLNGVNDTVNNTVNGVNNTVNNTLNGVNDTVNNTVNGVNQTLKGLGLGK